MEYPKLIPPAVILNGPFAEKRPSGRFDRYYSKGTISIPLNDRLDWTEDEPTVLADHCYVGAGSAGPRPQEVQAFMFLKYRRTDGAGFNVVFADGPCQGERILEQPVQVLYSLFIPLESEECETGGRIKVFAHYEQDGNVMRHVETHRQHTDDLRFAVYFKDGPLEGRVWDTDAESMDREGAMAARVLYMNSRDKGTLIVGNSFATMTPYSWKLLEDRGIEAAPALPPRSKYRIATLRESACEIVAEVEYVGPETT